MKLLDIHNKTILISRTDSIGDVVLTLPCCVWLKRQFPTCKIIFLGNSYTKPVLACLPEIDEIIDWKEVELLPLQERVRFFKEKNIDTAIHVFPNKEIASLLRRAQIPHRIGTSHRVFHFLTCNIRPNFTRKNSELHESQLNFELLRNLGVKEIPTLEEIASYLTSFQAPNIDLPNEIAAFLSTGNKTILLHPKSQGSAVEWGVSNYVALANLLVEQGIQVLFTGTEKEGNLFRQQIPVHPLILDSTGKLSLDQLIRLIADSDGLVACSTGPLHISGILGKRTVGLFSPRKPIHPGRWRALGDKVTILVNDEACPTCKKKQVCNCIEHIAVQRVFDSLIHE